MITDWNHDEANAVIISGYNVQIASRLSFSENYLFF